MTLAIAIGAAVLLLIAGLWYAFGSAKKKTPFLPDGTIAPGTRGVITAPGLGTMADIIINGTDPRTGKLYGKIASDVDLTNEANKKIVRKMAEDLASGSPGAMVSWVHRKKCSAIRAEFDVGRLALTSEKGESKVTMIPGFITPGGLAFVPIEFTKPYSFITYDRSKYMILISGRVDTSLSPVIIPQLIAVFNKTKRDFEKSFDFSKHVAHKAQGRGQQAIRDALNTDPKWTECPQYEIESSTNPVTGVTFYAKKFNPEKYALEETTRTIKRLQSVTFEPFL